MTIKRFALSGLISLVLCLPIIAPSTASAALSKAEGKDTTAAARAQQWSGLVIGVNEGSRILVITEAPKLDHIKAYPQRTIALQGDTELVRNDEVIDFSAFQIGMRVTAQGSYNASTRIISANTISVGSTPAKNIVPSQAPAPAAPAPVAAQKSSGLTSATKLKLGDKGPAVVTLQNVLIKKGFLIVPKGTKLGNFGSMTQKALKKYQAKYGIAALGIVGPQTTRQLLSDLQRG